MNIQDYLKYYSGQQCQTIAPDGIPHSILETINYYWLERSERDGTQLIFILRKLKDITKEEMIGLLQSMVPGGMEDKPANEEYDLEMFYNDDGNLVDADVAVGANYTCRCYEGQIAIRYDGSIDLFDEDGERQGMSQAPLAFHYLLSKGFDLFSLIDSGAAIDSKTLQPQQQ